MFARPLPILVSFFAAGILSAAWLAVPGRMALIAGSIVFLFVLAGYLRRWPKNHWLFCLLFMAAGFALARSAYEQLNPELARYCGHWVTIEGTVSRETDVRPESVYYYLDVQGIALGGEKKPFKARVLVKAPAPAPAIYAYGDILRVHGLLTAPREQRNPGEFDYRAYLERRGVGAILKVTDAGQLSKIGEGGNFFVRRLLALKQKMLATGKQTLSPEKAALVNGIVFGTQGEIPGDLWQLFSATGIVHILSVSGMHVGLLLAGMFSLFNLFRVSRRWRAPAAGTVLIIYALLCGLGPAVTRASLMGLMFVFAHHFGRDQDWPTTLSFAGFVCLLLNPLTIYEIGFQLSFAATWGILYLGPVLDRSAARFLPFSPWLKGIVWVTLAAQLATLPLIAWYYNIVSVVALLANIVAAPLTGGVLALGLAAGVAGFLSHDLAGMVNASTSFVLDIFIALIRLLSGLPGSFLNVPAPPPLLVLGWFPLLYLAGKLLTPKKAEELKSNFWSGRWSAAVLGVIFLAAIAGAGWRAGAPPQRELVLHLIDVGQGDSIFIQTPAGKNILVDAGGWNGEFESGRGAGNQVVVPYLRRLGVKKLDLFVITHPHEDHAGGAKAVAGTFPVKMVVISPFGFEEPLPDTGGHDLPGLLDRSIQLPPAYLQLLSLLINKKTPVYPVKAGDVIECDPYLEITVLSPSLPLLKGTRSDENNASLVLQIRYGEKCILLAGDTEREAQELLCRSGYDLGADILKVPHHGSRFCSPAFLENVRPSLALASAGRHNRFGLPAPETLEMLKKLGAEVHRTDEEGAVIVTTDGKNLKVKATVKKAASNF